MTSSKTFLAMLAVLLFGYAYLDKGFAYLGVAPIYIGEVTLAVGLIAFVMGGATLMVLRSWITLAMVLYAGWGAAMTLPSVGFYGFEALRNSVLWSYSAFAFILAAVLLRTDNVERSLDWFGKWMPWLLLWAPIGFVVGERFATAFPLMPGADVRMLTLKGGDLAVHLAGVGAFLALRLNRIFPGRSITSNNMLEYVGWGLLALGIIVVGSRVRAGLLAFIAAMSIITMFKPANQAVKIMVPAALLVVLTIMSVDISIPTGGGRSISPNQIYQNIESMIPGNRTAQYLQDTKSWRMDWWKSIIDYTVFGDYFWTGKGFGANLALDDGFYTGDPNRSPHNALMTILARSGVPGAAFWIILQLVIAFALLKRFFTANSRGLTTMADVNLFLLVYWLAFNVNMSFDVYLEGPQGGIWYWCLVGYIIAYTIYQDLLIKQNETVPAAPQIGPLEAQRAAP